MLSLLCQLKFHFQKVVTSLELGKAHGSKVMLSASRLTVSNSTDDRYLSPKLGKITCINNIEWNSLRLMPKFQIEVDRVRDQGWSIKPNRHANAARGVGYSKFSQVNESCKLTPSEIELLTQKALELQNYLERENLRPGWLVTSLDLINSCQFMGKSSMKQREKS